MGSALRQATLLLAASPRRRKLLLLVTDGKPNDLDRYEGRYGVEDTRQAVIEARRQGLLPFCITIDREAGSRSEEHTSELQSLMRNSYAVFCLKKKNKNTYKQN